jgi:hypothetical protein
MRHLLLMIVCMLPGLAGPADHFNLARILVTGSQRYREDDLVRATGLTVNTQVTSTDLQNGSPVDACSLIAISPKCANSTANSGVKP